jgi:hypothetical protein
MFRSIITLVVCALGGVAHADEPPTTYALIVGANTGGPGQVELHFAEDDARRVGALLTELGGYAPANVDIVVHPTPDVLRDRLARLATRVQADIAAGKQARIFFYYSGHARAAAIDLGTESLPLSELRQRLFAVPATLTVVVLDACQSGAFSRIKGAAPAADFSFNSRQQLDATGVAVLASSSGSELSQESEQLKSSYFTHHLLVGMRGAGDANHDGQVSVDEAYRYAYHQTLLATAATAVGGQHVTLEVDLKGHGEVPLSFPRAASATIELPAALEGKALVQDKRAKAVVAETYKAKGAPVRIAVAPGDYEVLVRQGNQLLHCQVTAPGAVDLGRCSSETVVDAARKGGGFEPRWRFDVGLGFGREGGSHDNFSQTLQDFGYREEGLSSELSIGASREYLVRRLSIGGLVDFRQSSTWKRDTELSPLQFRWSTTLVGANAHYEAYWSRRSFFYGDTFVGLGIGRTHFEDQNNMSNGDTFFGPAASLGAGLGINDMFARGLALSLGAKYGWAPVIENDIGDTHDSGGLFFGLGMSYTRGGSR